jgi:hypothetical protein
MINDKYTYGLIEIILNIILFEQIIHRPFFLTFSKLNLSNFPTELYNTYYPQAQSPNISKLDE